MQKFRSFFGVTKHNLYVLLYYTKHCNVSEKSVIERGERGKRGQGGGTGDIWDLCAQYIVTRLETKITEFASHEFKFYGL